MNDILQLRSIGKSFAGRHGKIAILQDLDFTLPRDSVVGIIAPSGAGKTTLLQIAGLMDVPDTGEVIIDGHSTRNLNDNRRAALRCRKIGYVYQKHHLLAEFTALENVMMPLLIAGLPKIAARKNAVRILCDVQLSTRLDHKPAALSGGEQQRVAIARAMAGMPELLLADEPTGNLDPETSAHVFAMMLDNLHAHKRSALIVTHNYRLAVSLDRLFELKHGQLLPIAKSKLPRP